MIVQEASEYAQMMDGVPCFQCGKAVEAPFVYCFGIGVDGETINMAFHSMCASRFGARFMDDVRALPE